ncbi:MAG: nucleoside triphosphate pyrophosphohydrolase [archaeon]
MTVYNKLVRDNILDILSEKGLTCKSHVASKEEYLIKLKEKLQEEVSEFLGESNKEELADILEVVYAIADSYGVDKAELNRLRKNKAKKRGRFIDKIILEEVFD